MNNIKNCIDGMIKDLNEINIKYIQQKEYETAALEWQSTLFRRHYYRYRYKISESLHMGLNFSSCVEEFTMRLQEGNIYKINLFQTFIKVYGAQTNLPKGP